VVFFFFLILTASMGSAAFAGRNGESSFQLNAAVEGARVTLTWDAMENAEGYNLLYTPMPMPTHPEILRYPVGNQTTLSFDLSGGVSYYAAMEAVTGSEVIGYSSIESVMVSPEPSASASLTAFESDQALAEYLKSGLSKNAGQFNSYHNENPNVFSPFSPAAPGEGASADASTTSFSTTNLQEAGVDEADIIKTDGQYLYIAPSEYGGIQGEPTPLTPETGGVRAVRADASPEIGVFEITDNPPGSTKVGAVSLDGHENFVKGLYLLTDRGEDKPDLLVTIGGQAQNYWEYWCNPWYWTNGTTEVGLYNVSDPLDAEAVSLITLDGQLISSRRIGDVLYVVTRFTPGLEGFNPNPADKEEEDANSAALEKAVLTDLLPGYTVDGQSQGSMVQAQQCFLPPYNDDVTQEPTLITVTAITLSDPGNPVSQTITGPTETIYVSTDTLYLATTRYEYTAPTADPDLPGASTS
ncbi:MAG: hypothetical protein GY859_29680, partial [Desulfobacterales bacterium]|nr:hypothetical protein [Desulfobacterales bacterium]